MLDKLKKKAVHLTPSIWIGKNGLNKNVITQVDTQLDSRELVKIKVQKVLLSDHTLEEIASRIQDETGSIMVERRGRTLTFYREVRKD